MENRPEERTEANELRMGANELRFARIIWENAPLSSKRLAELAKERLGWAKTTSYTVLKRLCDKGLFKNEGAVVTALISREEYHALRGEQIVDRDFGGSLPAFVAAFTKRRSLSAAEVAALRALVDEYEGN